MEMEKHNETGMVAISFAILLAINLILWTAAQNGAIPPVGNSSLWICFVSLSVVSIIWGVVLLGLHPLVVCTSYGGGALLAFIGARNLNGFNLVEMTSAGATCGAFGALLVGNATATVRMVSYDKKQVSFVFIIVALLVLDACLSSGVSSAGRGVVFSTVILPFVIAGGFVGLGGTVLVHRGAMKKSKPSEVEIKQIPKAKPLDVIVDEKEVRAMKIEAPKRAEKVEEVHPPVTVATAAVEEAKPVASPETKVENEMPLASQAAEEDEFFPLEIDKDDEFDVAQSSDPKAQAANLDTFSHDRDALEERSGGGLIENSTPDNAVQTPSSETDEGQASLAKDPQKEADEEDWLSGHMDLLNKLK